MMLKLNALYIIDMMQLKNLHENATIERVYDYAWNEPLISLLILSLLELLTIIVCLLIHNNWE